MVIKNTEKIIGNIIDKQSVACIGSIDKNGFPTIKAMLPPRKKEGVKEFYFTTNTSSMRVKQYKIEPKACIYFYDKRFYQGITSKLKKIIVIFGLCLFIILSSTGCGFDRSYKEDNPELFTVAIYSLLGAHGYTPEYHGYVPIDIEILEEDDYGRVLFAYCEDQSGAVTSLLIIQKSDETYSYYYPDYNFISKDASHLVGYGDGISGRSYTPLEKALPIFTSEDKLFLKELNDWNKPIDETKCIKYAITRKKEAPQFWEKRKNKEEAFETLCQRISTASGCKGEDTVFRFEIYFVSDNYGRTLYYVYGLHRDVKGEGISPKSEVMYFDMVVILNSDGTYGDNSIMRLRNMHDYQDDLKAFKELNNWNIPL